VKIALAIIVYVSAIVAANLLIAEYGPSVSIINAFALIGLDLALRDYLHQVWSSNRLPKMLALIGTAGGISYALNPATERIAIASLVAFTIAGLVDWLVYDRLKDHPWMIRSNGSNIAGAGADSFLFPAIAFGFPLLIPIMLGQFAAKIMGGFLWSTLIGYACDAAARRHRAS